MLVLAELSALVVLVVVLGACVRPEPPALTYDLDRLSAHMTDVCLPSVSQSLRVTASFHALQYLIQSKNTSKTLRWHVLFGYYTGLSILNR